MWGGEGKEGRGGEGREGRRGGEGILLNRVLEKVLLTFITSSNLSPEIISAEITSLMQRRMSYTSHDIT